jgi:hypothetical protein
MRKRTFNPSNPPKSTSSHTILPSPSCASSTPSTAHSSTSPASFNTLLSCFPSSSPSSGADD